MPRATPAETAEPRDPRDFRKPGISQGLEDLTKLSVDPEIGSPGTENYSGWIYREWKKDLVNYEGHGSSGTSPGTYEKLARTDPALVLMQRSVANPIATAALKVEGPIAQHAEFVEQNLTEWLEPGIEEFHRSTMRGMFVHGFSLHEIVPGWMPYKGVPGGKARIIARLAERLQRTVIGGWREKDGALEAIEQRGYGSLVPNVKIPASQVLLFSLDREGRNYEGNSGLRSVAHIAQVRQLLIKLLPIAHDRESLKIPNLEATDKDVDPLDKSEADAAIQDLMHLRAHEMLAYICPPGWKLVWTGADATNKSNILDSYERLGQQMLYAWMSQHAGLGTTTTGSRAVGDVLSEQFWAVLQFYARYHESVWNGIGTRTYTGAIKRLVDWNFGPQEEYPRLSLTVQKPRDLGGIASLLTAAKNAGALTADDGIEDVVREEAGFPPMPDEARDQDRTPPAPVIAAPFGQKMAPAKGKPPEKPEPKLAERKTAKLAAFTPARPLRPAEEHLALAEMAGMYDDAPRRLANVLGRAVERITRSSVSRYRRIVEQRDTAGLKRLGVLKAPEVATAIRRYVDEMREAGKRHVRQEHDAQRVTPEDVIAERQEGKLGLSERLGKWHGRIKLASAKDPPPVDEEEGDRFDDLDPDELADALADDLADDVTSRVQRAATGEAGQQMTRGAWDEAGFVKAIEDVATPRALERDAATITAQAFNLGREEMAAQYGEQIEAVQYSAVLDGKQCEACDAMDGDIADFNSPEHDAMLPPNPECESTASGFNRCRCLLIYVFNE